MKQDTDAGGTVGKALALLDIIAEVGRPIRFTDLLPLSPHPKATLYRLLQTLTNQGMLSYNVETQQYGLGMRLVRLAHGAWQQFSLAPLARPIIEDLSRTLAHTVHLAQLDNGQVLYVDKRNAADPIEMYSQAGKVGPAYCTGVGKAMLAFLDDDALQHAIDRQAFNSFTTFTLSTPEDLREELGHIRERGYAFDREEHEPTIICIAVPILSAGGQVMGGLSVTSNTSRSSLKELETMVPHLRRAAKSIADAADTWRFPDQTQN